MSETLVGSIAGFKNYEIHSNGEVWSIARGKRKRKRLKPTPNTGGYLKVGLTNVVGCRKIIEVHKLVLKAFRGLGELGMQCRHLDGNKLNNNLENLKWGTPKENGEDRVRHGTVRPMRGELNGSCKLKEFQVLQIAELIKEGTLTQAQIGKIFGVSKWTIQSIKLGRQWKYLRGLFS